MSTTTYQGHHSDGSSVQKHSAGSFYPYVLQQRDRIGGGAWYELIGPGVNGCLRFGTLSDWEAAARRLLAVRQDDDAWAFELEQLQTYAGQRLAPMQAAAQQLNVPSRWAHMSKVQRVDVLLRLGAVRNTLAMTWGNRPAFAALANVLRSN